VIGSMALLFAYERFAASRAAPAPTAISPADRERRRERRGERRRERE
jgi:hypothetical protein